MSPAWPPRWKMKDPLQVLQLRHPHYPLPPFAFSINSQSLPIENTKTVYEVEKWEFAPGCIRSEAEGRPNSKLVAIFCSFVVAHGRLTDNLK